MTSIGGELGRHSLDILLREGKHAVRRLLRDWPFSAGAIVILALGIGVNTAVFSLVNATLFRPYPFADSARLVNVYQNGSGSGKPEGVSYPAFLDLRRETTVFAGVSAYLAHEGGYQVVNTQGQPDSVQWGVLEYAAANHLDVLGMRPSIGRWFSPEEELKGEPVAVLGRTAWQRKFGSDPNVIGRTIRVSGVPMKVIGVGPVGLNNSESHPVFTDVWMPIRHVEPQRITASSRSVENLLERRANLFLQVRARLREDVSVPQAQAAMDVLARRLSADHPETDPKRGMTVLATDEVRIHPQQDKVLKPILAAVLMVVGLVLAIACSNLATLLTVRGTTRAGEISVRLALGATRWQLVRHLLAESMILASAGAVVGVALAVVVLRYCATLELPFAIVTELDYRVLGFATAVATMCGIGFGLAPALKVTRTDLAGALREQRASASGSVSFARGWFTLKNVLIVGQVAASFLLLMGATLATTILAATQNRSVGFRPAGLAMIESDPRYAGYDAPRARAVFEELRTRIGSLPGVESAFITTGTPPGSQFDLKLLVDGGDPKGISLEGRWADPGYFQTVGIPILNGRGFEERDSPESREVAVVSETLARRYFGTSDAVGKRFRFADAEAKLVEIVGVVGDTRDIYNVSGNSQALLYRSATQAGVAPSVIVARTSGDAAALARAMRQEVMRLHPELSVSGARTMDQLLAQDLMPFRVAILSLGGLGAVGLALAGVGLYAVVAFAVAQRSSEIGIRMALGARAGDLTWLAVRELTALVLTGIGIGSAISWAGLIALESSTGPIVGATPMAVAIVAAIIVLSGAMAAFVPARRAAHADPLVAIRHQ